MVLLCLDIASAHAEEEASLPFQAPQSNLAAVQEQIERGEPEAAREAISCILENPAQASDLFSTDQPLLVLWLAPVLLQEEESSARAAEGKQALAQLFLAVISRSEFFEESVRSWAKAQLQQASPLQAARMLLWYNRAQFQQPGLPALAAPGSGE